MFGTGLYTKMATDQISRVVGRAVGYAYESGRAKGLTEALEYITDERGREIITAMIDDITKSEERGADVHKK